MRTPADVIHEHLAADDTFTGLLPGGVLRVTEVKRTDLDTPPFDANGELLACCNVKNEAEVPFGIHDHSSRATVLLFFYQQSGHGINNQAMHRAYVLLDRQCIGSPEDGFYEVRHADDIREQEDQALLCSLGVSRYAVVRMRA